MWFRINSLCSFGDGLWVVTLETWERSGCMTGPEEEGRGRDRGETHRRLNDRPQSWRWSVKELTKTRFRVLAGARSTVGPSLRQGPGGGASVRKPEAILGHKELSA